MKILLIYQYFHDRDVKGGSRFNEMTVYWSELGHQTTVLAGMLHSAGSSTGKPERYRGKYVFEEPYGEGVRLIRSHVSGAYNSNFLGRLWGYFSFVFSSLFAGMFRARESYDMVIVSSPSLMNGITGYLLSRFKRIPLVFEIRDLWPESAIDAGVLNPKGLMVWFAFRLEAFLYRKSKKIVVLTPAFKRVLVADKNVDASKVVIVPNGADFRIIDELTEAGFDPITHREALGFNDSFVLTYAGAHGRANHLIQLVDGAERIKDTNALIVLVGDGPQKKSLIDEADRRGLRNIRFIDSMTKTDILKLISASDVGISVLKKADTFKTIYSNKTFDYMGCKKPVLMMIDGASRELIEDAKAGVYAEPEDVDAFEKAVRNLLVLIDKGDADSQGENGYVYARKHFSRRQIAVDYARYLSELNSPGSGQ